MRRCDRPEAVAGPDGQAAVPPRHRWPYRLLGLSIGVVLGWWVAGRYVGG